MTAARNRRERILDAAEQAFAEFGFAGASLRHIVQAARVNLATVYYYFGSKEELMEAVVERRFGPLRTEHMETLQSATAAAGGRPLAVEQILSLMLGPSLRLAIASPEQGPAVARLLGRIVTEPNPQTQDFLRRRHTEVRQAFIAAMHDALPALPLPDLRWRMEFVWGALAIILCNPRRLERETRGACDPVNADCVLAEMIAFFAPGFRAQTAVNGKPQAARSRTAARHKLKSTTNLSSE
jgi:AcrR family transcriptional regulator